MMRDGVTRLSFSTKVHTADNATRGSRRRNLSLLCSVKKAALQGILALAFICPLAPTFDSMADDGGGSGPEYKLGPQDQVRIRVHEWRASRDEIFEWNLFNSDDTYTVSSSGYLALPLLGEVSANGMSTAELAREIGRRLKDQTGHINSPNTIVEIVQFRPFYIVGAVDKPGEYPYRPGLTVLQAYSIAGGRQRNPPGVMRLEREAIATRGELRTIEIERYGLVSRMARLKAELANATEFELPPSLMKKRKIDEAVDRIVEQERLVFETRKKTLETQLSAFAQLESYLEQGAISMQKRLKLQKTEVEAVQKELDSVTGLFKKGLASAPRKLALQRTLAQVGGDRMSLESTLMQVRQELGKTKIATVDLLAKRTSDISAEMRQTQARLEELKQRTRTSQHLLYESEVVAPQNLAAQTGRQMQPLFKILRQGRIVSSELIATETTTIEPGDTIKVELPLSNMSVAPLETSSTSPDPAGIKNSAHDSSDRLR